jgi:hypothetical protein
VDIEELRKAIYELTYKGVKLRDIEKDLGMPANSLSGMLSGTRPFASKWIPKLEAYVKANPKIESVSVATKVNTAPKKEKQTSPPAITKTEQLRLHRTKTQTLE